jgi:hypothetical protein
MNLPELAIAVQHLSEADTIQLMSICRRHVVTITDDPGILDALCASEEEIAINTTMRNLRNKSAGRGWNDDTKPSPVAELMELRRRHNGE